MVHPGSQWLYVITNSVSGNLINTTFINLLAEGGNVAFMYNATNLDGFYKVIIFKQLYSHIIILFCFTVIVFFLITFAKNFKQFLYIIFPLYGK